MKNLIEKFAAKLEGEVAESKTFKDSKYPELTPKFSVEFGRKYARVVKRDTDGGGGSVWGFVEILTGDIYKAAGWKAPAKHVRGNIATSGYGVDYTWTGPHYLS